MSFVVPGDRAGEIRIAVKAVPGSRKDQIVGLLGDRLKVKVAAAPEDGKANAAICGLLASSLGVRVRDVILVSGHASAEKVISVSGVSCDQARSLLGIL
jgi:uncharacterized protein (TIGR00251 family)